MGEAVGRIGLLECYKLLQLNQTATASAATFDADSGSCDRKSEREQQPQTKKRNVCDRSDDILKALRTLRLSRSLLRAKHTMLSEDPALAQRRS